MLNKERTAADGPDPRLGVSSLLFEYSYFQGPDFTLVYGQTFMQRYGATLNADIWFRKMLNDNSGTATGDSFHSTNNYQFVRYAYVLFMYVECLDKTNATAQAYYYVN